MRYQMMPPAKFGMWPVLAMVASFGSIFISCSGHWIWGLILALAAMPLGAVGLLRSIAPEIRGGPASIAAIIVACIGVVVALVAGLFNITFWTLGLG